MVGQVDENNKYPGTDSKKPISHTRPFAKILDKGYVPDMSLCPETPDTSIDMLKPEVQQSFLSRVATLDRCGDFLINDMI